MHPFFRSVLAVHLQPAVQVHGCCRMAPAAACSQCSVASLHSHCLWAQLCAACRLAASDGLDEHAPFSVGVPSWLRESSDPAPGHNYFFMHIKPAEAQQRQQALVQGSKLLFGPRMVGPSPIPNLVLGPLLGKVRAGCLLGASARCATCM